MRSLFRVLREGAPCGGEKQIELVDGILAPGTNQQMLLKARALARR
jgi:hypothetical protein